MRNTRLATRYAHSLITLAEENGVVEEVLKDMQYIGELCDKSRDFILMLRSPIIKSDKKLAIMEAVFGDKISALTQSFIELLVKKKREFFLPEMAEAYQDQYNELNNIHVVKLTTAVSIDPKLVETIKQQVAKTLNQGTVEMEMNVDADIIGGFVLEIGDQQYDASVDKDLRDIKKQFTQNLYIPTI